MTSTDRPIYYNRQGVPITLSEWAALLGDNSDAHEEYRRVRQTTVGPCWVSTVWLGIDHSFGYAATPIIFETMIFVRSEDPPNYPAIRELDTECWRYSTEAEALAGHEQVVAVVRDRLANVEAAEAVLAEAMERAKEKQCHDVRANPRRMERSSLEGER